MSWDLLFVGQLNATSLSVEYVLEFIGVHNALGKPIKIHSNTGQIQIARGSVRIQGTSVIPQRWSVTFGGFSIQLSGSVGTILPNIRKGQIAVLHCSVNGGKSEKIAIGQLHSFSGTRGLYTLQFIDIFGALQTRLDTRAGTLNSTSDKPRFTFFYNVGQKTTTTATLSTTDVTLSVADTSVFNKSLKSGSKGILKCIPTTGDTFYLLWSAKTSTTFTVETTTYNNATRIPLPSGSEVVYCAWLYGEPYEILASILLSTGTSSNGEFDVYPEEWGIGGKIGQWVFDVSDAKRFSKEIVRADGGDYDIGIAIESPLTDGIRSIINIFSTVGIWPVYRQGSVSLRCATDPEGKETRKNPDIRAHISDYDIIDILSHEFFSPDIQTIYRETKIKYNFTNYYFSGGIYDGTRVQTLPATESIERDFSLYYLSEPDNRQSSALSDLRRLRVWDLYISERLTVRLPLRFCTLVAGDIVTFISSQVFHLYDNILPELRGRYAQVLSTNFSIDQQTCIVTIGITSPKPQRAIDPEETDGSYTGWEPNDDFDATELIVWLVSEDIIGTSGADVSSWDDRMNAFSFVTQGGNNNTSSGNSPSYEVTAGATMSYVRFDHTNHEFLAESHDVKMNLSSADGVTIVAFLRRNPVNSAIGDPDYNGASYKKCPIVNHGRSYQLHLLDDSPYTDAAGFENGSNSASDNNLYSSDFFILIYTSSAISGYTGEQGIYVNGIQETSVGYDATSTDESSSPDMRIGRDPDITYGDPTTQYNFAFGSMDIVELQVYNQPMHDSERQKIEGYIAHKYGYTSLLDSSHPYKTEQPS
tara:strand:+ start:151 stop:2592 length:2442 start_codon:yes stop_codon:yes gene_type:complete